MKRARDLHSNTTIKMQILHKRKNSIVKELVSETLWNFQYGHLKQNITESSLVNSLIAWVKKLGSITGGGRIYALRFDYAYL